MTAVKTPPVGYFRTSASIFWKHRLNDSVRVAPTHDSRKPRHTAVSVVLILSPGQQDSSKDLLECERRPQTRDNGKCTSPSSASIATTFPADISPPQAHRIITQVVLIGSRVLGRAFAEAYKQASTSSAYQRAQAKNGISPSGRANLSSGMTLSEACQILNVKQPANGGKIENPEEVFERFKKLFDANDPQKGGSFYLQSKVLRARERLEAEIKPTVEKAEQEAEVKAGWKPKVYKDR